MIAYDIDFPQILTDQAWLVEEKGFLSGVVLTVGDTCYRLSFYDPVRLRQTVDDDVARAGWFFERNLVVVRAVTRANIEAAMVGMARHGGFGELLPEARPLKDGD